MEIPVIQWIPGSLFLGALFLGALALLGSQNRLFQRWGARLGCLGPLFAFLLTLVAAERLLRLGAPGVLIDFTGVPWFSLGTYTVFYGLRFDCLSMCFSLLITGVGFLIHLFSLEYMREDEGKLRFFFLLNLFCGFMLVLILARSLPLVFLGWEGVGLCSYLLISFWFKIQENHQAGLKAFLYNRVGDAGLLIGMALLFHLLHTLDFGEMNQAWMQFRQEGTSPQPVWFFVAACLWAGVAAKSAQMPLWLWLPDAMKGPTPVSALIHAATMVTAGVYLLIRLFPLLQWMPELFPFVFGAGFCMSMLAGLFALHQLDLKKTLAFSTVSQLGLVMMGLGSADPASALAHVLTHGGFKALLFLCAGVLLHLSHKGGSLPELQGIARRYPLFLGVFSIGVAAILGLPPFSGFYSKDALLESAYHYYGAMGLCMGLLIVALTAAYMTRLFYFAALAPSPHHEGEGGKPHAPKLLYMLPLCVLAGWVSGSGLLGLPSVEMLQLWLGGEGHKVPAPMIPWLGVGVALLSAAVTLLLTRARVRGEWVFLQKQLGLNEGVQFLVVQPLMRFGFDVFTFERTYQRMLYFFPKWVDQIGLWYSTPRLNLHGVAAWLIFGLLGLIWFVVMGGDL
jgi:NADH-quinone oxidoreductase subunit L